MDKEKLAKIADELVEEYKKRNNSSNHEESAIVSFIFLYRLAALTMDNVGEKESVDFIDMLHNSVDILTWVLARRARTPVEDRERFDRVEDDH